MKCPVCDKNGKIVAVTDDGGEWVRPCVIAHGPDRRIPFGLWVMLMKYLLFGRRKQRKRA